MRISSDCGLFVWHEVGTSDLRAGGDFYAKMAGWKAETGTRTLLTSCSLRDANRKPAFIRLRNPSTPFRPPPSWLSYIGTPDVDATERQAVELGGKVMVSAYNAPSVGRTAHLQDPQGASFAVSSQEQRSRNKDPQLGDFSWHELLTTNWQTAFDFYSKLFGWEKMEAMDMGRRGHIRFSALAAHQLAACSIRGTAARRTALDSVRAWSLTRDARPTSAKELGATIAHGPSEVPGGDWVFTGIDPQGAMFAAHSKKRMVRR